MPSNTAAVRLRMARAAGHRAAGGAAVVSLMTREVTGRYQ